MPSNRNLGMSKTRMSFFRGMSTEHLVRIAAAGGGIRFNVRGRSTDDLVRIAAAASTGGARLFLSGMSGRPTDDLIKIAAAGKGAVVFEGKLTAGRSDA
jgi:hypothetical protein